MTYCSGPTFKILNGPDLHTNLTPRDYVNLAAALNDEFAADGWRWSVERITEGGVFVYDWPNRTGEMYKSIRIPVNHYPHVDSTSVTGLCEFSADVNLDMNLELYPCERGKITTFLKAFNGAPTWTPSDLNRFVDTAVNIWGQNGLVVKFHKSSMPTKSKLVSAVGRL